MGGIQLIYWMLRLTTHCHICYRLHPFHFVLFKDLVAKQQTRHMHFSDEAARAQKTDLDIVPSAECNLFAGCYP